MSHISLLAALPDKYNFAGTGYRYARQPIHFYLHETAPAYHFSKQRSENTSDHKQAQSDSGVALWLLLHIPFTRDAKRQTRCQYFDWKFPISSSKV